MDSVKGTFRLGIACIALISVLSAGCGAIMQGTRQTIPVQTSPDAVSIDVGGFSYTSPTTLELERKNDYILKFSKDGYESAQIQITKHLSGSYLVLDVLFTGLIGVVVDAATGAWNKLRPEAVMVSLSKISSRTVGPAEIEIAIKSVEQSGVFEIDSSVPEIKIQVIPVR